MVEGKTIRLRASCNACNEAKVRCSQRKPNCVRCERNGVECVYGLSRRTHRDAPPISATPSTSQRSRGQPRSSSSSKAPSTSNSNTCNPESSAYDGNTETSPERSAEAQVHTSIFDEYTSPDGTEFTIPPQQLLDLSNLAPEGVPGTESSVGASTSNIGHSHDNSLASSAVVTRFPTPTTEYGSLDTAWATDMATFWTPQMESVASTTTMTTATAATSLLTPPPPLRPCGECTCHAGVVELLASMRGVGDDRRPLSMDAKLAMLKRCILSGETSMACAHGSGSEDDEPIHIMLVATLIGYVIAEFEMLACKRPLRKSTSLAALAGDIEMASENIVETKGIRLSLGSDESMSDTPPGAQVEVQPRLSWGVLELEDDDERDLLQRLYLLLFRKLERLLSQLTQCLRNLHDAGASVSNSPRHMAFVMACDYTRLWLEKKADDVKRLLLSVSTADDTVDPALPQHMQL